MTHNQKMFSIRDSKGEIYHPPFFKNTHGEAERQFMEYKKNPETLISKYPEDFDLYYIGEFDTKTGKLVAEQTPQHIIKAVTL